MTWIKTVPPDESEEVRKVVEAQREFYPIEYATRSIRRRMARPRASSHRTV